MLNTSFGACCAVCCEECRCSLQEGCAVLCCAVMCCGIGCIRCCAAGTSRPLCSPDTQCCLDVQLEHATPGFGVVAMACHPLHLCITFPTLLCCPALLQVCGGYPDAMSHLAQLLDENLQVDFVDINCGEAGRGGGQQWGAGGGCRGGRQATPDAAGLYTGLYSVCQPCMPHALRLILLTRTVSSSALSPSSPSLSLSSKKVCALFLCMYVRLATLSWLLFKYQHGLCCCPPSCPPPLPPPSCPYPPLPVQAAPSTSSAAVVPAVHC